MDVYQRLPAKNFAPIRPRLLELWDFIYNQELAAPYRYVDRLYILPSEFLLQNAFADIQLFAEQLGVVDSTWIRFLFTENRKDMRRFSVHQDSFACVLNYPLLNAELSETKFYRIVEGSAATAEAHINLDECKLAELGSVTMRTGQPCLLRTEVPHMVCNRERDPSLRVICGWGIKEPYQWPKLPQTINQNLAVAAKA